MINNPRYVSCVAVIFSENVIVPFWKCKFIEGGEYSTPKFSYEDEETTNIREGLWDCKKNTFVSFFVISRIDKDEDIKIGDTVFIEDYSFNGKRINYLDKIKNILYDDSNAEYYYERRSETSAHIIKEYSIPEEIKIVTTKIIKPHYVLESGKIAPHSIYIKKVNLDNSLI